MGANRSTTFATAAALTVLVTLQLAAPAQALEYMHSPSVTGPLPCFGVNPSGPTVHIGDCGKASSMIYGSGPSSGPSSAESTPVHANATLTGADVLVWWEHDLDPSDVHEIHVLRGPNPDSLHHIGTADAGAGEYQDRTAVSSAEWWYAVEIVTLDGDVVVSDPVFVNNW